MLTPEQPVFRQKVVSKDIEAVAPEEVMSTELPQAPAMRQVPHRNGGFVFVSKRYPLVRKMKF